MKETPITNLLIKKLIMIQPLRLRILTNPQVHTRDILHRKQQQAANAEAPGADGADIGQLTRNLHADAVPGTRREGRAIEGGDGGVGEDAGEERADHAAYAVEFEDVEAFVDVQPFVQVLERGAYDCGEEADECRRPDEER